jgi:hypothetical protein
MNGTEATTTTGSVVSAVLATAFVVLLLVALMDPAGTPASPGMRALDPGHSRQLCPGDPAADSPARANAGLCTR